MAPTTPPRRPARPKGQAPKKSSLAAYAAKLPKADPNAPNTKKDAKGNSVIPSPGALRRDAPNTPLGAYANKLVAPRQRLTRSVGPQGLQEGGRVAGEDGTGFSIPGVSSPGGGSWFQNLGKDALSIVTGLPGTIALAGRVAASPATAAYGYGGGLVNAPGAKSARGFTADTGRDVVAAGAATIEDIKYRYGPAWDVSVLDIIRNDDGARRKVRTFGSRIKEHPGFFALDVASLASAGAGAGVKGAQAGRTAGNQIRRAREAREPNVFPNNTPPPGSSGASARNPRLQPAGPTRPRAAGPLERVLSSPAINELADQRKVANRRNLRTLATPAELYTDAQGNELRLASSKTQVERRPLAANLATRRLQLSIQKTSDKLLEGIGNRPNAGSIASKLSTPARDARAIRRDARRQNVDTEVRRDQHLHEETHEFARDVLYKREISKDPRKEALVSLIHDNIAIPKGGKKASERLLEHIRTVETEIARQEKGGATPDSLKGQKANLELLRSIPAELADNPTPAVVKAADWTRKVLAKSQEIRRTLPGDAGISETTRLRAGAYREAVGVAGARFFEDAGAIIHPERREKLIKEKGYQHVEPKAVAAAVRALYKGDLFGARNAGSPDVVRAAELLDAGLLPERGSTQATRALNAKGGDPGALYNLVARALDQKYGDSVPLKSDGTIDSAKAAEIIADQRGRGEGRLERLLNDPDNLFPLGEKASPGGEFRTSSPVGFAAGHKDDSTSFGLGEVGTASKRTTGQRILEGGDSLSRETTMRTIQRALNALYTKESVKTTIDSWALKAEGSDKPYVFREATAANRLDPEKWTLVDTRTLERVVEELGDAADPNGRIAAQFDNREAISGIIAKGEGTVIALPTPLFKEISKVIHEPNAVLRRYDKALDVWRAGILAYTPRWFVNNLLGTSVFLGVLSGLDLRAFRQASRNGQFFREHVIPHRVESTSHSNAIGKADEGRGGLEPQATSRFMRGAHTMFQLNERLEGRLRRAAYISRSRQTLRTEGRLRNRSWGRKLDDQELFDAMVNMPDNLKEQTLRDVEFFVGQYKSFSGSEKRVMRRIIPFYSWLRVINTWAFGLPFKSPLRAEALRIGTTATAALAEDTDGLPLWEKGRFTFGKFALRTNNINPLFSVAEEINSVTGAGSSQGALTGLIRVAGGSASPPLQAIIGQVSGRNPFGTRDFTQPLGAGNSVSSFGSGLMRRNPVTGEIEDVKPAPDFLEQLFDSTIPGAASLRQGLQGTRQAYDNASTVDLIANALGLKDDAEVFQPPPVRPNGRGRLPKGLGTLSALAGAPIYTVDREQEKRAALLKELKFLEAQWETERAKRKEIVRRGGTP